MSEPARSDTRAAFKEHDDFGIRILSQSVERCRAAPRFAGGELPQTRHARQSDGGFLVWTIGQQHHGKWFSRVCTKAMQRLLQLLGLLVHVDSDANMSQH